MNQLMLQNGGLTQLDEGELLQGDVAVRIVNSSINYKDALALTGKAPIIRRFPIVPGVDLAGIVEQSKVRQLTRLLGNIGHSLD